MVGCDDKKRVLHVHSLPCQFNCSIHCDHFLQSDFCQVVVVCVINAATFDLQKKNTWLYVFIELPKKSNKKIGMDMHVLSPHYGLSRFF